MSCAGSMTVVCNFLDSMEAVLTVVGAPAVGAGAALEPLPGEDGDELHPNTAAAKKDEASHERFIARPLKRVQTSSSPGLPDREISSEWRHCAGQYQRPLGAE